MSTLNSRLTRIEQRLHPPGHPLLDDPAIIREAQQLAEVLPLGALMLDCLARRDAAGLQAYLDQWADLRQTLARLRSEESSE